MKTRQQRATRTSVRRLGASGSTNTIICDMIKIGPSDTRKEKGMKQAHRLRLGFPTLGHNSYCKARTACAPLIACWTIAIAHIWQHAGNRYCFAIGCGYIDTCGHIGVACTCSWWADSWLFLVALPPLPAFVLRQELPSMPGRWVAAAVAARRFPPVLFLHLQRSGCSRDLQSGICGGQGVQEFRRIVINMPCFWVLSLFFQLVLAPGCAWGLVGLRVWLKIVEHNLLHG